MGSSFGTDDDDDVTASSRSHDGEDLYSSGYDEMEGSGEQAGGYGMGQHSAGDFDVIIGDDEEANELLLQLVESGAVAPEHMMELMDGGLSPAQLLAGPFASHLAALLGTAPNAVAAPAHAYPHGHTEAHERETLAIHHPDSRGQTARGRHPRQADQSEEIVEFERDRREDEHQHHRVFRGGAGGEVLIIDGGSHGDVDPRGYPQGYNATSRAADHGHEQYDGQYAYHEGRGDAPEDYYEDDYYEEDEEFEIEGDEEEEEEELSVRHW